jgi:hypothetical protein
MRQNKTKRSLAKKTNGKRAKKRPVDPKKRAAKRLRQAERLFHKYDVAPPTSAEHVARRAANNARLAALRAGTWPEAAPAAPSESDILRGEVAA